MRATDFLAYFHEDRFIKNLRAGTKDGVLAELVRTLGEDKDIRDADLLLEMVRRRESLGSTGIGHGVAVPHGRSTAAAQTKVVFALSKKGINFEASDGLACHLFFLIVAPYEDSKQEYLPLLGKIVETVNQDEIRGKLMETDSFAAFQGVVMEAFGE